MKRTIDRLTLMLLAGIGLQFAAAVIAPFVPLLIGLLITLLVARWLFDRHGPGSGGYR
jgi:hypothetical protein